MDGAKNAMYAQAGRSRSWSKVQPVNAEAVVPPAVVISMPEPPVVKPPVVKPPVVKLPVVEMPVAEPRVIESVVVETTVMEQPELMNPQEDCQVIAMAYVEMQKWHELYETEHGFSRGTIFAELDLPWKGKGGCKDE